MPLKRPPDLVTCCSRMPLARPPIRRSTLPMMPAMQRVLPYLPDALIAATPLTNSVSPSDFSSWRPVGAVHLAAFLEAGRGDVVAAADIGQQILKQIAVARPVPHMMVGIDDRQLGLDDLFLPPVEPVRADRRMAAGRDRGLGHGSSPPEVALGLRQLCPSPPRNSTALSAGGGSTLKTRRNFPALGFEWRREAAATTPTAPPGLRRPNPNASVFL